MAAAFAVGCIGAAVGVPIALLLLSALIGWPGTSFVVANGIAYATVYVLFFPAFSFLFARGRPAGLRFGSDGIELAAERRDALAVPYQAISSARVRWWWPLAMLEVFVDSADESRVMRLHRGGRRPLRKRKGDRLRFAMPIAGLRSSASEIRSELRLRGLGV